MTRDNSKTTKQIAKYEGVNELSLQKPETEGKPFTHVEPKIPSTLGTNLDREQKKCPKCKKKYFASGVVRRETKYKEYWYMRFKHYSRRNKLHKITAPCYIPIREPKPKVKVD